MLCARSATGRRCCQPRLTTGSSGALQPGDWDATWHPPQLQGLQPGLEVQSGSLALVQESPLATGQYIVFPRWNKLLLVSGSSGPSAIRAGKEVDLGFLDFGFSQPWTPLYSGGSLRSCPQIGKVLSVESDERQKRSVGGRDVIRHCWDQMTLA